MSSATPSCSCEVTVKILLGKQNTSCIDSKHQPQPLGHGTIQIKSTKLLLMQFMSVKGNNLANG